MAEITRTIAETRARAGDLRQRDLPRGFTLALVLSSALVWTALAGHRLLPVGPHQPAHPGADDRARAGGGGTIRDAAPAGGEPGRDWAGGGGLQHDGRPAAAEPRAPGLPDAGGELADAGAQDGARAEELADADSADGRGDCRAAVVGRPGVLRARRRDRGGRGDEPRAPGPRVLGVRRGARGARGEARPRRAGARAGGVALRGASWRRVPGARRGGRARPPGRGRTPTR